MDVNSTLLGRQFNVFWTSIQRYLNVRWTSKQRCLNVTWTSKQRCLNVLDGNSKQRWVLTGKWESNKRPLRFIMNKLELCTNTVESLNTLKKTYQLLIYTPSQWYSCMSQPSTSTLVYWWFLVALYILEDENIQKRKRKILSKNQKKERIVRIE